MKEMTINDIDIKGITVSLYHFRKKPDHLKAKYKNIERILKRRRLVNPDFIELYYKIQSENSIEENELRMLWDRLTGDDKEFFSYILNNVKDLPSQINSKKINIIVSKYFNDIYLKMKLLEDGIKAGSINPGLIDEYVNLIEKLTNSGQFNKMTASRMIRLIKHSE